MATEQPWPEALADLLHIEPAGDDRFTVCLRGFGGITLGCATLAAARTCGARALDSSHVYFLRPVPTDRDVELVVERIRDGRRFAHRRVQVTADGQVFCDLIASFVSAGEPAKGGTDYQDAVVDPLVPAPETLPPDGEVARAEGWDGEPFNPASGPLEWRWIGTPWRPGVVGGPSQYCAWVRPRVALPDDHALNVAALAFLSDFHSHWSVARKLNGNFAPIGYTSLDQALWVHRDLRWDDWWLLTTESDVAYAGRAFTRRVLHTRDGRLVASMAQEALIPSA